MKQSDGGIKEACRLIAQGGIVAFCGAGLSSESGIPTFRGKGGFWETYDPAVYATIEGIERLFLKDPCRLKSFIIAFYRLLLEARPNFSHHELARLENSGLLIGTITQNIDDFHQQAASW